MKYNAKTCFIAAILTTVGTAGAQTAATGHGDPYTPVGSLTVTPTVVLPGIQPDMRWQIEYPRTLSDLAVVGGSGQLVLTEKTDLKVRVPGVAFQSGNTKLPAGLWIRVGTSAEWELIFYGTANEVKPTEYVYVQKDVPAGTTVDFCGRGRNTGGSWYSARMTSTGDPTVLGLLNGDSVPDYAPAYSQGRIESFMTQFLDEDNHVVLGPRDIIHTFELDSTNPGDWYFDMQDLVIVTTVGKDNNGHGNNLDGVDVSNPGQGGGGPNGAEDLSGSVDDEGKISKGRRDRD